MSRDSKLFTYQYIGDDGSSMCDKSSTGGFLDNTEKYQLGTESDGRGPLRTRTKDRDIKTVKILQYVYLICHISRSGDRRK